LNSLEFSNASLLSIPELGLLITVVAISSAEREVVVSVVDSIISAFGACVTGTLDLEEATVFVAPVAVRFSTVLAGVFVVVVGCEPAIGVVVVFPEAGGVVVVLAAATDEEFTALLGDVEEDTDLESIFTPSSATGRGFVVGVTSASSGLSNISSLP
jgi:hypothetical protein